MDDTKKCRRCGEEKLVSEYNKWKYSPDGLQSWCRICQKWEREVNQDKYKANKHNYYEANKSYFNEQSCKWCKANPEARKAIQKRYRQNNLEHVREMSMVSYRKNYEKNREKIYANAKARRALKRNAKGKISAAEWREKIAEFNSCCAYCLKHMDKDITMDHMIPLSKGGEHTIENVVPACRNCNSQKQKRSILSWLVSKQG